MKKIRCFFGFHPFLNCSEYSEFGGHLEPDTKIEYSSPWSLFGTRYTRYQCNDCGRKFWMPKYDFEEIKAIEQFIKDLTK